MQLLSKFTGMSCVASADLLPTDVPIMDLELYENSTVLLLKSGLVLKSSEKELQRLHVPSNSGVVSIAISMFGVYSLSALGVMYGILMQSLNKNTHFKMTQVAEGVKSINSGFFCCAVDENSNLWTFQPEKKICQDVSCVKTGKASEFYTLALCGVEKNQFERGKGLRSLMEIAEEKLLDMVVMQI